jgi:prephenate dehydratase
MFVVPQPASQMSKTSAENSAAPKRGESVAGTVAPDSDTGGRIAYQGEPGANSHLACRESHPGLDPIACATFEDALAAVRSGEARYAMIPIENSVAGRVADIHHLLPNADLYIVGEHFLRVRHQLMAIRGANLNTVKRALSHTQALGQCRRKLHELGLKAVPEADTAGSARMVSEANDPSQAAIASSLAAEIYGLEILANDIEDEIHNTTRFVVLASEPDDAEPDTGPVITSFIFRVRNVPAALYKALGGFATNGVNMTKLESYQLEGTFNATMFYADIEGHPAERSVQLALEELSFLSSEKRVLGTYPASPYRAEAARMAAAGMIPIRRGI